jgi:hypothetical protein
LFTWPFRSIDSGVTVKASARILGIAVSGAGGRCGSLLCARRWGAIRRNCRLHLIGGRVRGRQLLTQSCLMTFSCPMSAVRLISGCSREGTYYRLPSREEISIPLFAPARWHERRPRTCRLDALDRGESKLPKVNLQTNDLQRAAKQVEQLNQRHEVSRSRERLNYASFLGLS